MAWHVDFKASAKKQLKKLDRQWQKLILDYLDEIALLKNPRDRGKSLKGNKKEFWRFRVGDYRILCDIDDGRFTILVVIVGHRKEVYK